MGSGVGNDVADSACRFCVAKGLELTPHFRREKRYFSWKTNIYYMHRYLSRMDMQKNNWSGTCVDYAVYCWLYRLIWLKFATSHYSMLRKTAITEPTFRQTWKSKKTSEQILHPTIHPHRSECRQIAQNDIIAGQNQRSLHACHHQQNVALVFDRIFVPHWLVHRVEYLEGLVAPMS